MSSFGTCTPSEGFMSPEEAKEPLELKEQSTGLTLQYEGSEGKSLRTDEPPKEEVQVNMGFADLNADF
jgi:hypothetical protein